MTDRALDTLARAAKGPVAPAPRIDGPLGAAVDVIAGWPGVTATAHWDLFDPSRVDGVDFYVGEEELGHIHLDGSIHLATSPSLADVLVGEGAARRFRYGRGWVCQDVHELGSEKTVSLFRRNYERLAGT